MSFNRNAKAGVVETFKSKWTRWELRRQVPILMFGSATLYIVRTLPPVCSVAISKEYSWNNAETGLFLSTFFWGYMSTQLLGGWLSDRVGAERVIQLSISGWLLVTVLCPLLLPEGFSHAPFGVSPLFLLTILRILTGACQGFYYPSISSLTSHRVASEQRASAFSIIGSGNHVGTLITGGFGSFLLSTSGWRNVYYSAVAVGACWLLLFTYTRRSSRSIPTEREKVNFDKPEDDPVQWRKLFCSKAFWAMIQAHFFMSYAFYILLSWLPSYFHETFPHAKGWIFNVVPWLVNIPSSVSSGFLADTLIRQGYSTTRVRKFIMTMSLLGTASMMFVIPYINNFNYALFCMALAVAFTGFNAGGVIVNPADLAPRHAGAVFGLMNTAGAMPGFFGVYVAGLLLEHTHSWAAVFQLPAALAVLGWLLYTLFYSAKQLF